MDAVNLTELRKSFLPDEVFGGLSGPVRAYIQCLETIIEKQQEQIRELQARVEKLEARLAKNSSNSGKPPSSDGFRRVLKSPREKSDKKPGGQKGHTGSCLAQMETPDRIVSYTATYCSNCGLSLDEIQGHCVGKRQVFEIPQPKMEVTEHRVEKKRCPRCGKTTRAGFPKDVRGPVQYGHRVQALETYLSVQHLIPVDRVCEIFSEVWGIPISPGVCANINRRAFQTLEPYEQSAKEALLASRVLHFDETSTRYEKKLDWLHVASSKWVTSYTSDAKRGREAIDAAGILPKFRGTAVHDHWQPYFSYENVLHSLCNAHHLRELAFIHEERGEDWARQMKELLIFSKREVQNYAEQSALPEAIRSQIETAYTRILQEGFDYHASLSLLPKNKKGKQKQREGKNFLDRLDKDRASVLRFIEDFSVPFTNNQAERDIRMVKLKQKVSGCFRGKDRGQIFFRIRGYLSTARKQGWAVWDALSEAVRGNPRLVQTTGPP